MEGIIIGNGGGSVDLTQADATTSNVLYGKTFYSGSSDEVQTGTFAGQAKTVDPHSYAQDITPDAGRFLSSVHVNPVALYGNATADRVIYGSTFYNTTLNMITGTCNPRLLSAQTTGQHSVTDTSMTSAAADAGTVWKSSVVASFQMSTYNNASIQMTWYIQGSNDNSNWTNVASGTESIAANSGSVTKTFTKSISPGSNNQYRYWRTSHNCIGGGGSTNSGASIMVFGF